MQTSNFPISSRYEAQSLLSVKRDMRVYTATDLKSEETVVVKLYSATAGGRSWYEKERRVLTIGSGVEGVPRLRDQGECDGEQYLVLEYEGAKLADILTSGRVLTHESLLFVGKKLIGILEGLHAHEVLYLNFSPENILVDLPRSSVSLTDYTAARVLSGNEEPPSLSPLQDRPLSAFVSTDQLFDQSPTYRSDIESLAFLLMFLEEGTLPWMNARGEERCDIMVYDSRKRIAKSEVFQRVCSETRYLWTFAHALERNEKPNYSYLKVLFRSSGNSISFVSNPNSSSAQDLATAGQVAKIPRYLSEDIAGYCGGRQSPAAPIVSPETVAMLKETYFIPLIAFPAFQRKEKRQDTIEASGPVLTSAVRTKLSQIKH